MRPNTPKVNLTELKKRRQHSQDKENIRTQIPTTSAGKRVPLRASEPLAGKGVLFGSAFEDKFFDIIENEEVENETELTEKLLETALDMDVEEMRELQKIEMKVDTTYNNLQIVGEIFSSLEMLRLSDSFLNSLRDLGTSFRNLRVLWVCRCDLKDLSGIVSLESLNELYASYNYIDDLFELSQLMSIKVADFEGNTVKSFDEIMYLTTCHKLKDLCLVFNPITKERNYR